MQESNIHMILVNDMPIFLKPHCDDGLPFVNKFIEDLLAKREAEKKVDDNGNS